MKIVLKRVYDDASNSGGYRVLVDRIWPRGIKKEDLKLDEWCKEIAPSGSLRKWFNHEVEKFDQFNKKYQAELNKSDLPQKLIQNANKQPLVLLYSAKDTKHNQAVVLKEYLESLKNQ